MRISVVLLMVAEVVAGGGVLEGETYRIGPGQLQSRVSEVARKLTPGDVVEITGDLKESIELVKSGTMDRPIIVRGVTRAENGKLIRPKVTFPDGAKTGIVCRGNWNIIEGLDIAGACGKTFDSGSAVSVAAGNVTIRNCYIHHSRQGVFGDYWESGDILIEFCEFDSIGGNSDSGSAMHTIFLCSTRPGVRATLQFCYLHDSVCNAIFKSRMSQNVIRYNWFENEYFSSLQIIDSNAVDASTTDSDLYPMHSDIVGNVFVAGHTPGHRWATLSIGGEGSNATGTEGVFNIAHNLFVNSCTCPDPPVSVIAHGNVDRVRMLNNAFLNCVAGAFKPYARGINWPESERTKAFMERRGNSEPDVDISNNWVSQSATAIPEVATNTIRGINPKFVDFLYQDYRPRKDSPLAGAGMWPLPKGQIIDLAPEFEPQRGIPVDLRHRPRRKAVPPSIGAFEVPE